MFFVYVHLFITMNNKSHYNVQLGFLPSDLIFIKVCVKFLK